MFHLRPSYKALAISLLIFSLFILGLFNTYLHSHIDEELFSINYITEEEKVPSEEEVIKKEQAAMAKLETHRGFNEAQKHTEKASSQMKKTAQDFEERMQAMEDAIRESKSQKPLQETTSIETINISEKVIHNENVHKQSSISYSLVNRTPINLPNPVYTCYNYGTIVINITVNNMGEVIHTDVDNSKSTSSDKCLKDRALEYANQTRFNVSESSNENQTGSITYSFIGS